MPIEPEMVVIPAGPVTLGVPDCPDDTQPHRWARTRVDVPAFAIARYAITVREYLTFAGESGYAISELLRTDPRFADPRAPAAFISWIDAVRYTQWLSRMTGKPYRLVRDAEYEKASRGGFEGLRFPWGDEPPEGRADIANPDGAPRPVGSFAPNGYGLHDMVGSVWSWCEECYDQVVRHDRAKLYYDDTLLKDPRLNPICRGGSFKTGNVTWLHCAYRHEDPVDGRFDCIGLRVALSV
ncbi:MAG: SUMF1/EgtB/PvdO family nonheme iron enzyme [Planctomycetes bacterium]|nr:SUMF1/EgtB/PvdO family nonheme iron enzyme [Planctomycetota bacterium]